MAMFKVEEDPFADLDVAEADSVGLLPQTGESNKDGGARSSLSYRGGSSIVGSFQKFKRSCIGVFYEDSSIDTASTSTSTLNMMKGMIGACVVSMPATFKWNGIVLNLIVILFIAVLIRFTMLALVKTADSAKANSFEETISYFLGKKMNLLYDVLVIVRNFGDLIAYYQIMQDVINELLIQGNMPDGDAFALTVFLSIFAIVPLCFLKKLKSLRIFSILATVFMFGVAILVFARFIFIVSDPGWGPASEIAVFKPSLNLFRSLPILAFALSVHPTLFPLRAEMTDKSVGGIKNVANYSISVSILLYSVVGIFGYSSFLGSTHGNIIINYGDSVLAVLLKILVGINAIMTFPIICRPVVIAMDDLLFVKGYARSLCCFFACEGRWRRIVSDVEESRSSVVPYSVTNSNRFYAVTSGVCALGLIFTFIVSDVSRVLGITGALAASFISLIIPSLLLIKAKLLSFTDSVYSYVAIGLGVITCIAGLITTIMVPT